VDKDFIFSCGHCGVPVHRNEGGQKFKGKDYCFDCHQVLIENKELEIREFEEEQKEMVESDSQGQG